MSEYRDLLASDEDREAFDGKLGLARVVFPYVENHNFYIEHWTMSRVWRKLRELGDTLAKEGLLADPRTSSSSAGTRSTSCCGTTTRPGPSTPQHASAVHHWGPIVSRRREIHAKLSEFQPPKALGEPPEVVTEPFTIMLWGITSESVNNWLGAGGGDDGRPHRHGRLTRCGRGHGPGHLQAGGGRRPPRTARSSWPRSRPRAGRPVFPKIQACVTDIGGMMSHAAIVCREYGVPAVTGTGFGTVEIKTGDRIRVDGGRHRHQARLNPRPGSDRRPTPQRSEPSDPSPIRHNEPFRGGSRS